MEKKITITGAGGYIGRHVVTALLNMGYPVTAVDINTSSIDSRANRISLNIFETDNRVYEQINKPEICLHLAWQDGFNHFSESHINNLPKHFNFIKNLVGSGLRHIAIMGSMHEIGYWEGEVSENTPTNPISYYGIAKNSLRQAAQIAAKENGVIFQWLRAYYIIGDDLNNNSIFSKVLKMEKEGKKSFPVTSGENEYDFIHIDNLSQQIASCIIQDEVTGIINCCSGEPISLREMLQNFIKERKLNIEPRFGDFPERPYDSPAIWGRNRKINEIMMKRNCNNN